MARLARLILPGQTHWLIQRGHSGNAVFVDETDRRHFLAVLAEAAATERVQLHAYALLDTELQLLATPATATGLSRMMQTLGRRYVAAHNQRHGRSGTLWDGRFRCAPVQPGATRLEVLQLVDLPPPSSTAQPRWTAPPGTAAGGRPPEAAPPVWPPPLLTSASQRCGGPRQPAWVDPPEYWQLGNTPFDREAAYRARLQAGVPAARAARLRQAALGGWVVGTAGFAHEVALRTERPALPRARGRPRHKPA